MQAAMLHPLCARLCALQAPGAAPAPPTLGRRALRDAAAATLWALLGEEYECEEGAIAHVPRGGQWEREHLPGCKLRKLVREPAIKQVAKDYAEVSCGSRRCRGAWVVS